MTSTNERAVAVIGAGSIGVGWSVVFARASVPIVVFDVDGDRLEAAAHDLRVVLTDLEGAGLLDDLDAVANFVRFDGDLANAVKGASYVQECAPESLELKRSLFAQLDELTDPAAILASSSSAIPASSFAQSIRGQARCLVAHPANPPFLLPVVEIVPAPFTASETLERAHRLLSSVGMSVVSVRKEIEGFVYNRLQGALLREAYCLVRDGVVTPEDIDTIVHEGLGRRWSVIGPFETADLNTRGGIESHAARLGPAYERMGAERGQYDPWTPELVAKVAESLHRRLPLSRWSESAHERDRALMALERVRREMPSLFHIGLDVED